VTLYDQLVKLTSTSSDALLGGFLDYVTAKGLSLYPAQEEAILELFEDKNVILNTPTGSGKSLVASALHFQSLARGRRSVYTCPIKALVNEKWLALCREFGPDNVGLSTGDATVNREAPILCCTAEILANIALRDGERAQVHDVVMDEFHYYSDRERGVAWQAPLLTLPQTRFLLMSATLGETAFFEQEMTRVNGRPSVTIKGTTRPVPMEFSYAETPLPQTLEKLVTDGRGPVYVVHFTQNEAADNAQSFTSINVATRDEKAAIASALESFKFTSPYGPELKKFLRHGIGVHHAGLLPKYRILVEQLAQRGLLKVICGTDTLGVGINVPIRTVLFTRLSKYGGEKVAVLSSRDFHQIAGRAGRKGYDNVGWVVAQAPEHVVENLKLDEKAKQTGKKGVKKSAPDGFVGWDQKTFERLQNAPPEKLTSRFQVTHAMLLNVLGRPGDGCAAMRELIRTCHDSEKQKKAHMKRGWKLFRSLLDRGIIEIVGQASSLSLGLPAPVLASRAGSPSDRQDACPTSKLRVNVELPEDFSLNQALSLFLLDSIPALNPEAPDYAFDLISLIEGILEDPDVVLRAQLRKLKGEKVAELKAQGMEYDQRMEELEKLEHPKPKPEFFYPLFNAWSEKHPWVGTENIRLKSIAREMFEQFRSFADYIKIYELQRAEGVLLRHLNGVYKVLSQTVPEAAKTDAVREMEEYLRTMLRQVDSSLLDEWAKMKNPDYRPLTADAPEIRPPGAEEAAQNVTRDTKAFTAAIRTRIFTFLRALANDEFDAALDSLRSSRGDEAPSSQSSTRDPQTPTDQSLLTSAATESEAQPWTADRLRAAMEPYYNGHRFLSLDPEARNSRHTYVKASEDRQNWTVQQILVDPEGHNDWLAEFTVDLGASRAAKDSVMRLQRIGPVGAVSEPA
jgi:superfamily II RNA helicase